MEDLVQRLVEHKTLGGAPREELEWLAAHSTLLHFEEGQVVSHKGEQVENMYVMLTGHMAIWVDRGAGRHKVLEWFAGDVGGLLPYSRLVRPPGDSVTLEPSELLAIPRTDFPELIRTCNEVTSILVHKMLDRARIFNSSALLDEKMISLGRLSAGLAHELNNPASAIERSATLLEDRLEEAEEAARTLGAARLSDAQLEAIDAVRVTCASTRSAGVLSPIQQAEREDELTDWLTAHGLPEDIAGPLGETAVTVEDLDKIARVVDGPCFEAALRWTAAGCSVRNIASEIQHAAMRIAGLVQAIKGFTHMDQATVAEPVDLTSSLDNTVAVLKSKARAKSIAVSVTLEPGLPRVRAFAGEINQIWANLIDNALDAVPESGRVDVSATRERDRIVVRVVDNGSGIPPDIRDRIFDPFVTTKGVGKGTGLGLDIVRRLATHNDASIEVDSQPGRTEFRVSLPMADEAARTA